MSDYASTFATVPLDDVLGGHDPGRERDQPGGDHRVEQLRAARTRRPPCTRRRPRSRRAASRRPGPPRSGRRRPARSPRPRSRPRARRTAPASAGAPAPGRRGRAGAPRRSRPRPRPAGSAGGCRDRSPASRPGTRIGGGPAPTRPDCQSPPATCRRPCRPQWIRSGDRATHISGRVNGVAADRAVQRRVRRRRSAPGTGPRPCSPGRR